MKRCKGESLGEYCIVLGLVVMAAIPAIALTGNSLNDFYKGISVKLPFSQDKTQEESQTLSEKDTTNKDSSLTQSASSVISQPISKKSSIQGASYNSKDNTITFPLPDSRGGGTQTASAEGGTLTKLLAQQMIALAEELEKTGDPTDTSLAGAIRNFAKKGKTMGEGIGTLEYAQIKGTAANLTANYTADQLTRHNTFSDTYNTLNSQIEAQIKTSSNSSRYQELKGYIDTYTGIISEVSAKTMSSVSPTTTGATFVGTPINGLDVPVSIAQSVINKSSDKIDYSSGYQNSNVILKADPNSVLQK